MTPPLPLVDPQLERLLVSALIRHPEQLNDLPLAVADLTDFHAKSAMAAVVNVYAGGIPVTPESVRHDLQLQHIRRMDGPIPQWMQDGDQSEWTRQRLLVWYDDLLRLYSDAGEPPTVGWAQAILDLADARTRAIAGAEPPPKRAPRGPRCKNTEPVRLAEAFMQYAYTKDNEPTLVRWARAWWRYDGTRYVEHDDEALERDVIKFLDIAVAPHRDIKTGAIHHERVVATTKHVNDTRKALVGVAPSVTSAAPHWTSPLDQDPDALDVVACENGLLNLSDLTLLPRTPRFFATTAIAAPYDPQGPEPVEWLAFLKSVWGDDTESVQLLQQIFGYLLTADTAQQKLFAIIGPKRSGKGTIARVLKALLGDDAVVNPTLASLEQPFGLAPLVGKMVAIIGDARLGGKQDQAQVVERLLSISGEDRLSINRKNRDAIDVRLVCRVLLLSNELPRLYDTSGALASRFAILSMTRSFLGSEDIGLEQKLLAELPGIFRWAIAGRQDLHERGRFIEPLASEAARRHLAEVSSPIAAFLEETCSFGEGLEVSRDRLYDAYRDWCKSSGIDHPRDKAWFGRDLHTLHPEVGDAERRPPVGKRYRVYTGVVLQ